MSCNNASYHCHWSTYHSLKILRYVRETTYKVMRLFERQLEAVPNESTPTTALRFHQTG